ncbi:hypothetical protein ACEPAF_7873 [Sanghuangporus sanghuang]
MITSRGRRIYGSGRTARQRPKKLSRRQTNFLRKLIHVLTEVVDEKDLPEDTSDMPWLEERGSETVPHEDVKGSMEGDDAEDEQKRLQEMVANFEPTNAIYLQKFPDKHNPLVYHVKALLNTLGGGERTARALERMKDGLGTVCSSFYRNYHLKRMDLNIEYFAKALSALDEIVSEMRDAFKEFGVFSTGFFDSLRNMNADAQRTASQLGEEFGYDGEETGMECNVDKYLDSKLNSLIKSLETYIQELTSIAEKEIPAIRQSQEFVSQRYLNLTTIATFLSSVTATTLQITADGPVSILTTITNSFWFVSLVFSTASAVYSLLVMTWRQSPIRRPDRSLPSLAQFWLRNAPMFALIVALTTFSIGLCLLAFLIADQQERDVSAAVPTAFAGFHAYAIFFLSAWYLLEQWKARHPEGWESMVNRMKAQIKHRGKMVAVSMGNVPNSKYFWMYRTTRDDVEKGPDQQSSHLSTNHSSPSAPSITQQHSGMEMDPAPPETGLAIPESLSLAELPRHCIDNSEGISSPAEMWSTRHEDLIQFSADCSFLASAFSRVVTIYETRYSFKILKTIVVQDASPVRQILWNPNKHNNMDYKYGEVGQGDLVVRSSEGVYIKTPVHRLVELDCAVGPVRWIREKDNGLTGLSCLLDNSLKVFELPFFDVSGISSSKDELPYEDKNCKELYSFDFSDLSFTGPVLDAVLYQEDKIVCLIRTRSDQTRVMVIDRRAKSIKQSYDVFKNHTSMSVSQTSGRIFLRGGGIADMIEPDGLGWVQSVHEAFRWSEKELQDRAVGCFGKDENLVFVVVDTEIRILNRVSEPNSASTRTLHVFTTSSRKAIVESPISFAVGHSCLSPPYLFAFGDSDGSVKIWSIQNNTILYYCEGAQFFEVHDIFDGSDVKDSVGRFLTLPAREIPELPRPACEEEVDAAVHLDTLRAISTGITASRNLRSLEAEESGMERIS